MNLSTHLFNALVLSYAIIVVQYYNHHHDIGKSFEFQQIVGEFEVSHINKLQLSAYGSYSLCGLRLRGLIIENTYISISSDKILTNC